MRNYEGEVCRAVKSIVAVSEADVEGMRSLYGVTRIAAVPTGVNLESFAPPQAPERGADLVFVGSMDWMRISTPCSGFVNDILPLIQQRRADCSLAIAGRLPSSEIRRLAKDDQRILVTGTVPDVRPYLWGATVALSSRCELRAERV
jgi:hypothetical protein